MRVRLAGLRILLYCLLAIYSASRGIIPMKIKQMIFTLNVIIVTTIPVLLFAGHRSCRYIGGAK